jgi:hypothetical protein
MHLHQIQVTYHGAEDRLLCRASFRSGEEGLQEVRAWLTRRLVRQLWKDLIDALKTQVALDKPQAAHASAEIIQMEHQAFLEEIKESGNFSVPYAADVETFPLGETPILTSEVKFTLHPDEPIRLNFAAADGTGFELALTLNLLHGFCSMLKEAVRATDWELDLVLPLVAGVTPVGRSLN